MRNAAGRLSGLDRKRRSGAPSEHVARVGWLLITLLYNGVVEYAAYLDRFGVSPRQSQRDVRKIREIGEGRFAISRTKGGRVFLEQAPGTHAFSPFLTNDRGAAAVLARIAAALGGPLERELRSAIGGSSPHSERRREAPEPRDGRGFLHVREPSPNANGRVTQVFDDLKNAAAGPARVEFAYTSARGERSTRRVEPYHVIARSGRYYLVAYDLDRRGWRTFALDAIEGRIRKAGTYTLRSIPERYLAQRAVGWISAAHHPEPIDVAIRLSPLIIAAVTSRVWQEGQHVTPLPDGRADITLAFDDLGEAVRWSLQFGPEATIVSPPEAVLLARRTIERVAQTYRLVTLSAAPEGRGAEEVSRERAG